MGFIRRDFAGERQTEFVTTLAAASGVLTCLAGLQPTGSAPVDVVLVGAAGAAVVWAAASAPWWLVAGVAVIAAGTAASVLLVLVGATAVVVALLAGVTDREVPWAQSLAALLTIQVLARCEVGVFFGWSALFSCLSLSALFIWGVLRRPQPVRWWVWRGIAGASVFVVAAVIGFAIAGLDARTPLQEGNRQARVGLAALNRGDTAAAQSAFAASAQSFRKAADALAVPWAQGVRLLPVVAQHRESVSNLAAEAASATGVAADALAMIEPDTVRAVNGRIDLAAVHDLERPMAQLAAMLERLDVAVTQSQSPWLAGPLQRRLASLDAELATNRTRADNALQAVRVAPQMLGEGGVRRYFVAFTSAAEARGLGGFMGSWAELTITDGQIAMTRFGRVTDLEAGLVGNRPVLTDVDEFLQHWGRFGFANTPGGAVGDEVWSIVTMSPDFPTVGKVISQLYPQSGGQAVDGVLLLDSEAIAALLNFTGPLEYEGVSQPLTADNAAQFIDEDQYLLPGYAQRVDILEQIARDVVANLLSTTLPPPADLAAELAPLAAEGRFAVWSANPDEQQLFHNANMDRSFPDLAAAEGIAVTVDNAGGNKIDAHLEMTVEYSILDSGTDGVRTTSVAITLTNNAPTAGLPPYVIGNAVGLPEGTNRTWLSVYTALPMVAAQVDGVPDGMQTSDVFGWHVATRFVNIPAGSSVIVTLTLQGALADVDERPFVQRVPAMVTPPVYRVDTEGPS